jgi:hypothetical protein
MSNWKWFVRVTEIVTLLIGISALSVLLLLSLRVVTPDRVEGIVLLGIFAMFVSVIVPAYLYGEFARVIRAAEGTSGSMRPLTFAQLRLLFQWCPRYILFPSMFLFYGPVAMLFCLGPVTISLDEALTRQSEICVCVGVIGFSFAGIPILASVSRMPGTFVDRFGTGPASPAPV